MKVNIDLLREYVLYTRMLYDNIECIIETHNEDAYDSPDELTADFDYTQQRIDKLKEIEAELLAEINKEEYYV